MLSSISGHHFAGHLVPPKLSPVLPPNTYGTSLWYSAPNNSYPGSGTTIYDVSGSNCDLTTTSAPVYTATAPRSLRFASGVTGSRTMAAGQLLLSGTNYNTFDMWIKIPTFVAGTIFTYKDIATGDGYGFYLNANGTTYITSTTQYGTITGTSNALTANTWMLLSMLGGGAAGNNAYVYVNGWPAGGTTLLQWPFRKTQMQLNMNMLSGSGAVWSEFQFSYGSGGGMNKFNAERAYYGV